jgi:hypothetical protein
MAQAPLSTANNPARRILPVTGHKFFLLFLFLLAYLALYPYMGETGARYQVFRILGAAVTLMSVYAVSFRKGLVLVALILAGPALVGHAIVFRPRIVPASVFTIIFSFAFDVFIIVVISAAFLHAKSPPRKRFSARSAFISSSDFRSHGSMQSLRSSSPMPFILIRQSIRVVFRRFSILFL